MLAKLHKNILIKMYAWSIFVGNPDFGHKDLAAIMAYAVFMLNFMALFFAAVWMFDIDLMFLEGSAIWIGISVIVLCFVYESKAKRVIKKSDEKALRESSCIGREQLIGFSYIVFSFAFLFSSICLPVISKST